MTLPDAPRDGALDWALILAPYRRDADYLELLLTQHEIGVERAADAGELVVRLGQRPGVLVATHEALNPAVLAAIGEHLIDQPHWSEMPIVVLLDRTAAQARIRAELAKAWPRSRHLFYQRPMATLELISGIQSALLSRARQRDVRDHIEREVELRRELNHRVKNILASVASIFQMTRRNARSLETLADDFTARLTALAGVHSTVFQAGGEAVGLSEIVDLIFKPYRDRVALEGPNLVISREAATTLALCLHELITNALKYGALSRPEGTVSFGWTISAVPDPMITLTWVEAGGPPVSAPQTSGYGTRYVRAALNGLFGTQPQVEFHSEGVRCVACGQLSRIAQDDQATL